MESFRSFDPERWWVDADVRAKLLPDPPQLRAGRYEILRLVGVGGTGVVFEAFDPTLDRRVALKILRPHDDDAALDERIFKEARALARLGHPSVVTLLSVERHRGAMMIVMELLEGPSLAQWLSDGPHSWTDVVRHFADVARGLAAAHRAGIVHGDVKPDNVLFGPDHRVRVTDFGLAQDLTASTEGYTPRMSGGTEGAMSPEQRAGEPIDARSDQYSLCVAWAAALAGTGGRVPRRIARALARGLQPDPARRWASLDALLAAIDQRPRWRGRAAVVVLAAGGVLIAWPDAPAERVVSDERESSEDTTQPSNPELAAIEDIRRRARQAADEARVEEAVELAGQALARAEALGDATVTSRARLTHAQLTHRAGRYDEAAFLTAYDEAAGAGNAKTAALAASELAVVATDRDPDAAVRWQRRAELWHDRAGTPDDDTSRLMLTLTVAAARAESGDLGPALVTMLDVLERARAPVLVSSTHYAASTVYARLHRYAEAEQHARLALASTDDAEGGFARILLRLHMANVILSSGQLSAATQLMQRCVEDGRDALGPAHPDLALVLGATAAVHWQRGDIEALRDVLRQVDDLPSSEGLGAAQRAFVHRMRWRLAVHDGRRDDAWHHALAALEVAEHGQTGVAAARLDLAHHSATQGNAPLARTWLERAAEAPWDIEADVQRLVVRSRIAAAEGDVDAATELADAAVELADGVPLPLEGLEARRWRVDCLAQRGDKRGAAAEREALSLLASR